MTDLVADMLEAGGAVARVLGASHEPRPQQLRMARAVEQAMAGRSHLAVEAATGVGKSFAYLVPAIARAVHNDETVVVATNTIALQEQLLKKDIPLLHRALPDDLAGRLRPVLVKGRGNYLSIRRLQLASARQDQLLGDAASRRSLHVIEDWAYDTEDGTLSTLPALERPAVWDRVQSDAGNCMGRKCPTYDKCFYQSARRDMERANLLICNHALFFSDLALRARYDGAGFLPRYQHVVLDEAHMIEDVASDHFGASLSEARVMHLLSILYQGRTNKGYLAHFKGHADLVDRAIHCVNRSEDAAHELFDAIAEANDRGKFDAGRIREPEAVENPLTPAMNDLSLALRRIREALNEDGASAEADRFELNSYAIRAGEIASVAEILVAQTMPGCCYYIEASEGEGRARGKRRLRLACSPVDVAPALREHLFLDDVSVTMTSATLSTRTIDDDEPTEHAEAAFAHFTRRVGCEGAATLQLGSPFDHANQMSFHVDRTMPEPGYGRAANETHVRELVARVLEHTDDVGGGVFVLFTSFALLDNVAAHLEPALEALGYPLFVQGRGPGAASRTALLEAFRDAGNGVLLGAASFWQGVDVRGDALRCVIITRLPFDPPDRPLTAARLEAIRERGGDPFREESIPRALIRFKQGVGRLIRSAEDRGRVVVLDPRILTKGYGKLFQRVMPPGVETREPRRNVLDSQPPATDRDPGANTHFDD